MLYGRKFLKLVIESQGGEKHADVLIEVKKLSLFRKLSKH